MKVPNSRLTRGLSLAALGLLAACDVPTDVPQYTTAWSVPAKSTTISVNTLLPSGIAASADNSAFIATVSPSSVTISRTLGQDCAACALANGQTAPKPAFAGGGSSSLALPSGITSATLVRDTLTVTINNGFNFDPIRPSASARGYLVIKVASGATTVGRDSLDGAVVALPAGASVVRKIPLSGTVSGASGLQVTTSLNSPLGDAVVLDASRTIAVTGTVGTLYVSAATVSLTNQAVTASNTNLDLSDIDKTVSDHVDSGALLLTVVNPFNVSGTLTARFTGGTQDVVKTIALAPGTTHPSIALTGTELQSLFGHDVSLTLSGTVNGSGVTVTPGQTVSVASRLQIAVNVGGSN